VLGLYPITTLSDPQLTKALFGRLHPMHVPRPTDKQQGREDFLDEGPHLRKGEPRSRARPHPFRLQIGIRDGADQHMVLPTADAPAGRPARASRRRAVRPSSVCGARSAPARARRAATPRARADGVASRWPALPAAPRSRRPRGDSSHCAIRRAATPGRRQGVAQCGDADGILSGQPSRRLRGGRCSGA
jgi:hypothetical protein